METHGADLGDDAVRRGKSPEPETERSQMDAGQIARGWKIAERAA